jgi:hypothetical protein
MPFKAAEERDCRKSSDRLKGVLMMGILRSLRHAAVSRGGFWAVLSALVITSLPTHAAEPPARLKRADSFLGIHFDFHAGADCNEVGRRTTPEMVELVIDKVQPDYIQIDCKGHPGYSSYPTRVGNPAPGFVGDPLRVWRDATRRRGVALFMHYSGVWDRHAVATHPEWAAVRADGKPDENATSVFGPYADTLMIPQLRELAGDYGVDGAWVDGDCWGAAVDYRDRAASEFCRQSGAKSAPRKSSEPFWQEWLTFQREGYRRYLRHYVNQLKASHPDFQIVSNWAFSDHMPEPVSAGVAALSGDFSPDNSVNSARFSGRCLENQPVAWDLMSWSFGRKTRSQKPAAQLMQEAAVVLALGGGYQAYFKQDRDGAIRPAEMGHDGRGGPFLPPAAGVLPPLGGRAAGCPVVLHCRSLPQFVPAVPSVGERRHRRFEKGPRPDARSSVRGPDSQ